MESKIPPKAKFVKSNKNQKHAGEIEHSRYNQNNSRFKILNIVKSLNMLFVRLVLIFVYLIIFAFSKLILRINNLFDGNKKTDSYWTESNKKKDINYYQSPY